MDDPSYTAWLKIYHPTKVCSTPQSCPSSLVSGELSRASADSGKSSGDVLSEILALPCPIARTKSKCKPDFKAESVCITDDIVLEGLKRKEVIKAEAEKEREAKRIESEHKQKIREEKRLEREGKKIVREEKQLERERKKIFGKEK